MQTGISLASWETKAKGLNIPGGGQGKKRRFDRGGREAALGVEGRQEWVASLWGAWTGALAPSQEADLEAVSTPETREERNL